MDARREYELKLSKPKRKIVNCYGVDGEDAARRYVDCHRDAEVIATRPVQAWAVRRCAWTGERLMMERIEHNFADLEFEPGRWWRVLGPNGELWHEGSDEQEAREILADFQRGARLQRVYVRNEVEWRDVL